ncbi:MAG: agenet domain-containing protein, partial [Acidobacteriota bacterium]
LAAIATIAFMFAATSAAVAQGKHKIGDRVECDLNQNGQFKKGTIGPYDKHDYDQGENINGRYYRVLIDGSSLTEGYLCKETDMRSLVASPPANPQNNARSQVRNQSNNDQALKYKPGDRVQCDAAQIGAWKAGTVMHFLQTDRYRDANGGYFRVRLDNTRGLASTFDPGGQVCMANFMRPFNDGYKEKAPTAKRSIGDRLEAQSYAGNWFPAEIIAIEGDFYTVHYDNYDSTHDETVDAVRLRSTGAKPTTPNDPKALPSKMAGSFTSLPGTAWKIDWGIKGGNVQRFLFCKSGRWEVVSSQLQAGALTMMGSYTVQGDRLITKNRNGGMTTNYKMTWKDGGWELNSGKSIMKLYDPVETQCK